MGTVRYCTVPENHKGSDGTWLLCVLEGLPVAQGWEEIDAAGSLHPKSQSMGLTPFVIQLPTEAHPRRQEVMAEVLGFLLPVTSFI